MKYSRLAQSIMAFTRYKQNVKNVLENVNRSSCGKALMILETMDLSQQEFKAVFSQ